MNARRTAALLEVLGVYLAGQLVMTLLIRILGLHIVNPLANFTVGITGPELLTATWQMFVLLILQYAGYFLLIIPINWWHRRRGPAAYGLTRAGRSWAVLSLTGAATAALAAWPLVGIQLIDAFYKLGETVPWRQALFDTSWRRWEFWAFLAVFSFGLVAVLEEIFFRGYCQRRLAEDWGDGAAIIGTACLFTFAHTQYLMLNAYSVGMVASLFALAISFGVVFAWTRSLIPSMVAHAIINVTMTPVWLGVVLTAFVIGALIARRRGVGVVKQVFSSASVVGCVALGAVGAGWAIASRRIEHLQFAAAAMVIVAVGLELKDARGTGLPGPIRHRPD